MSPAEHPNAATQAAALRDLLTALDPVDLDPAVDPDAAVSTTTLLLGHLTELTSLLSARRTEAVRALLQRESGAAVAARHGLTRQTIHKLAHRR